MTEQMLPLDQRAAQPAVTCVWAVLTALALGRLSGCGKPVEPTPAAPKATPHGHILDAWAFTKNYRIAHYLQLAVMLQELDEVDRAARLRWIAADPHHGSNVYVLCRMLFDATPGGEFRPPWIGAPLSMARADLQDWPLEPIALAAGVPILVAKGYRLAGHAEPPKAYLEYCLAECQWRNEQFVQRDQAELNAIVERFVHAHPQRPADADWLRQQALPYPTPVQPDDVAFDKADFFMSLDWYGEMGKPVMQMAFATVGREGDLLAWRGQRPTYFRQIFTISDEDVQRLEDLFSADTFSLFTGRFDAWVMPVAALNQYVVNISTGGEDYHSMLGFGDEGRARMNAINEAIPEDNRQPVTSD